MKVSEHNSIWNAATNIVKNFENGDYKRHRVVTKVWKLMLLNNMDMIRTNIGTQKLCSKSLGAGVWELSLEEKK